MIPTKHMSRFKTLTFGLIPVLVLLLILEVIGRIVYPIDREKRARIKAARNPRAQMSYLSNGVSAEGILTDIRRMARWRGCWRFPAGRSAQFSIRLSSEFHVFRGEHHEW